MKCCWYRQVLAREKAMVAVGAPGLQKAASAPLFRRALALERITFEILYSQSFEDACFGTRKSGRPRVKARRDRNPGAA